MAMFHLSVTVQWTVWIGVVQHAQYWWKFTIVNDCTSGFPTVWRKTHWKHNFLWYHWIVTQSKGCQTSQTAPLIVLFILEPKLYEIKQHTTDINHKKNMWVWVSLFGRGAEYRKTTPPGIILYSSNLSVYCKRAKQSSHGNN